MNPACHICFYGLYATLNADYLLATCADSIIGGEFEQPLTDLVKAVLQESTNVEMTFRLPKLPTENKSDQVGVKTRTHAALPVLERLSFAQPARDVLSPLASYARLEYQGEERLTGYVEASRGCLHHCTHCPIPSVYEGRFFIVAADIILEDIRALVTQGAQHITFGDPDFLNGPTHALRVTRALHQEFPHLTFDFTTKVEHILKHRELFAEFAELGCIFIVSAVESLSDTVLGHLEKGHTRSDVVEALAIVRAAGITLRPTFVAFSPWTTLDDFIEVLDFIEAEDLIETVDPVQYSIRLLVPPGSLLLEREESKRWLGTLLQELFTYEWQHPDSRLDELQRRVAALVEGAAQVNEDASETFYRIRDAAYAMRGDEIASFANEHLAATPLAATRLAVTKIKPPRLTEAWFC